MDKPLLEVKDITKTYLINAGLFKPKKPLHAVNGASLEVEKGKVFGVVGESGCGKSTLAKMILGLEKPSSGKILLNGDSLNDQKRFDISRQVQPIFQDPYSSLNPRKTVSESITLPYRVHKVGDKKEMNSTVDEIMNIVGLPPRMKHSYPVQLSGGQRQRVAIARALIMRPSLVICDEPTSALDVSVQSQILNLLMDLRDELGLTYILISHDLSVVEHIASRVAVMYLGRIIEEAETGELFKSPKHPYTKALLNSVLTPDPEMGLPDTHLGISYPNPIDMPSGCAFHPRCPKRCQQCEEEIPAPALENNRVLACHFPN